VPRSSGCGGWDFSDDTQCLAGAATIQARIASRVTQKTLAGRLGVAEQQVQRWEATDYSGVSVSRVQEVVDALDVRVTETIDFAPARAAAATKKRSTRETNALKARTGKSRSRT